MAEINLHPDDTVMSGTEVVKKAGGTLAGLLFFEAMFYALYQEGEVIMALLCGAPLGLMALALASQCAMHFLGMGQMVLNEGTMTLRTSRSGKSRGGIFASLERIILAPLFMLAMRDLDKDGDGRFSYDEMMEEMDGDSKKDIMEMQELFEKHDKDGDGVLSKQEALALATTLADEREEELRAQQQAKQAAKQKNIPRSR